METEIKLSLPAAARAIVEGHPLFSAVEPRTVRNVSTYFDTPDFALRARGLSLRVRRSGDHWVQTVKSLGCGLGWASRGEWERPVPSEALDAEALARDPEASRLVADDLARASPVFTTDIQRTIRVLTLDGKTTVETAVDEGEVRAGDRRQALSEVELELKGGPVGPMLRLAADLVRRGSLRVGSEPKSERGYALLAEALPPPPDTAGPTLPDDVTLGDAFPVMLGAATRDFALDLSSAARGEVEGVHRLRAAIRRMRTLLVLFAPHLEPDATARFDGQLGDLGRVLGSGRDWDVFLTETLAEAERHLDAGALAPLQAAVEARRSDAQAAVKAAVDGPLPTDILLGLAIWTSDAAWLATNDAGARFRDLLPGLLGRLERKALKRGRRLGSLDTEALHDLRKSLKTLRYACEDVASLHRAGAVHHRYVATVKKVLLDLGHINDAAVAVERVEDLVDPASPGLAAAARSLLRWTAKRRRGSERDLARRWRKFRHAEPFWA